MKIGILNPEQQTLFFGLLFLLVLFASVHHSDKKSTFPLQLTDELKGFAILSIVFSHIGYFLVSPDTFLFPLSIFAGIGVNVFLFLSGFGLTSSALKNPLSVISFYKKRLLRIFIPMWLVVSALFVVDLFWLGQTYSLPSIIETYLGIIRKADIYTSFDSGLWYFSLILFYYLVFPLVTFRKLIYLSPILMFVVTNWFFNFNFRVDPDMLKLIKLHTLAFPLGISFALLLPKLSQMSRGFCINKYLLKLLNYLLLIMFLGIFIYTSYHSNVGEDLKLEHYTSILSLIALIVVFLLKELRFTLFEIFGRFSYEIYLIHIPILFRYPSLYTYLPAYLATLLYLILFISLSILIQRISKSLVSR